MNRYKIIAFALHQFSEFQHILSMFSMLDLDWNARLLIHKSNLHYCSSFSIIFGSIN